MPKKGRPMIEMRDLNRYYGDFPAVVGLSLSVGRGEIFTLLGPNGAGKTTTIKMLSGLLHPSRGRIRIGGYDLAQDSLRVRRILGYVPDFPFVYENLTPREFLEFVGRIYRLPEDRLEENSLRLLELFGLTPYSSRLVRQLSHGFRQRLVFASAFLHEPRVLLIDEPMVGLDPATGRLLKDALLEFAAGGGTVFLSTHTLSLAEEISDRIGIMARGHLLLTGTPEQVKGGSSLEEAFLAGTGECRAP